MRVYQRHRREARVVASSCGPFWSVRPVGVKMHLTVKNFEILSELSLPVEGITVVVGPSNNGKSSVIRALTCLLCNTPGDSYVQYGKSGATVGLAFPWNGVNHTIVRNKDARGAVYFVDGEKFEKVGRKNHLDLLAPFGIKEIQSGRAILPNIIGQFDGQFLTSYTPSEAFGVLSFMLDETRMQSVLKNVSACIRDGNEKLGQLQAVIDVTRGDVSRLQQQVSEKDAILSRVAEELGPVLKLHDTVEAADVALPRHRSWSDESARLAKVVLDNTLPEGFGDSVSLVSGAVDYLDRSESAFVRMTAADQERDGQSLCVSRLSEVSDASPVDRLTSSVQSLLVWSKHLETWDSLAFPLCGASLEQKKAEGALSAVGDTSALPGLVQELRSCETALSGHSSRVCYLRLCIVPSDLPDVPQSLVDQVTLVSSAEVSVSRYESYRLACSWPAEEVRLAALELDAVVSELNEIASKVDRCSMCGSSLDAVSRVVYLDNVRSKE